MSPSPIFTRIAASGLAWLAAAFVIALASTGFAQSKKTAEELARELVHFDARLESYKDAGEIPDRGVCEAIAARIGPDDSLRFRIFDLDGKVVLDKAESELPDKAAEIAEFKGKIPEYLRDLDSRRRRDDAQRGILNDLREITGYEPLTLAADGRARREAAYQLDQLGAEARPALNALVKALEDDEEQVWFHSIQAIAKIGPGASGRVEDLIRQLGNPQRRRYSDQVWYRTAFAIGMIGEAAVPAIQEALRNEDEDIRSGAAKAVTWIKEAALPAVPALTAALDGEDETVRTVAAEAIGAVGAAALPVLMDQLNAESELKRLGIVKAIGWMGSRAKDVSENLIQLWETETSSNVRRALVETLPRLHVDAFRLTPILLDALIAENEEIQQAAIDALLLVPNSDQTTVPALRGLLLSGDDRSAKRAAYVLGKIGPDAEAALPELIQLGYQPGNETARPAISEIGRPSILPLLLELYQEDWDELTGDDWRIGCLTNIGEQAMPDLALALTSESREVRYSALEALKALGDPASARAEEISKTLNDPESRIKAAALETLVLIEASPDFYLSELGRSLSSNDEQVKLAALKAATFLGEQAAGVTDQLVPLVSDSDPEFQMEALQAIGAIGPAAGAAEPSLLALLRGENHPDSLIAQCLETLGKIEGKSEESLELTAPHLSASNIDVRTQALYCLGQLQTPKAKENLAEVKRALTDEASRVRDASLSALIKLVSDPKALLPPLIQALGDESLDVRKTAIEGVGRLGREGQDAAPKLFELLDSDEDRAAAVDCIRQVRPRDPNLFRQALSNSDPEIRYFACESLGRLEKNASEAIADLRKVRREDDYSFVRKAAGDALERIEGERRQ